MDLAGKELGRYRVVSLIGSGGMGTVYDAIDSSLGRHVALKVLPSHLVSDANRVRRFVQEARAASALNHPHLVSIYDIGREPLDGTEVQFIAMEKIDGATLRETLASRPMPLKRALELMVQITEAVSAAHGAGVIHRDLKPENVMISSAGYVKVLDFGLAKLQEDPSAGGETDDATAVMSTQSGIVVGTAGYMSPEQAAGRPIDHRSDIFSLGCVLYEMAAGRRAFRGNSTIDTLHKIIHNDPEPLHAIAPETPVELQRIVRKSLAKDPDERYQSARELAIDLRGLLRDIDSTPSGVTAAKPGPRRWPIVIALAALLGIAAAAFLLLRRDGHETRKPMETQRLTTSGEVIHAAISPDGKYLAYVVSNEKGQALWIRQIATRQDLQLVAPAPVGYWGVTFTPDGNALVYAFKSFEERNGTFFRVSVLGGAPERLMSELDSPIAFSPDGKRVAWHRADFPKPGESAVMIANSDGSDVRPLATRRDPELFAPIPFSSVSWSPDGKSIATPVANRTEHLAGKLISIDVETKKETVLSEANWWRVAYVAWLPDASGLIVTAIKRDSPAPQLKLWLIPYPSGEPQQLTSDLITYRSVSPTADGTKIVSVIADLTTQLWKVTLGDGSQPVKITDGKHDGRSGVVLSPDGRVVYGSTEGGFRLVTVKLDGSDKRPFGRDNNWNAFLAGFRDGVVYGSFDGKTTLIRACDWSGGGTRVIARGTDPAPIAASPDGKWVAYTNNRRLWKSDMNGQNAALLADTVASAPVFSPDGNRIAFFTENAIVVRDLATGATIWTMPSGSREGSTVRWWPDGKSLVITDYKGDRANLYRIVPGSDKAEKLTNFVELNTYPFDIAPDGKTIVVSRGRLSRDAVMVTGFR